MYDENQGNYVQNNNNNDVTVGEWIVATLVMAIPFVNIIMMFVWAFGSNTKPSKANYFKAALIMTAISLALSFLIVAVFGVAIFGNL